jgi:GAF domain-containing protein/anti-sigma regulatory factor (Ser/Thr protein kinase)
LAVPLMHAGEAIGAIAVRRTEVRPFTERQIDLLKTFADQAVIAIENTRLFEEVQARTRALQESLEYQTAMSDVLGVISSSPDKLQPVLDAIVNTAKRLCIADRAYFNVLLEGRYHSVAATEGIPRHIIDDVRAKPEAPGRGSHAARAVLEKRPIHIEDTRLDPEFTLYDVNEPGRARTVLGVPLLRRDEVIGVITLARIDPAPFTQRQIDLVATFANQAVIAINNVDLFEEVQARTKELQESLEYQTATSEVLNVISRSKFDLQPVVDTIVETAVRLCRAHRGALMRFEGAGFRLLPTSRGNLSGPVTQGLVDKIIPIDRGSTAGRVAIEGRTVHIHDLQADPDFTFLRGTEGDSRRTCLGVPLIGSHGLLGAIILQRTEVLPFTDRQIELVETFADQAVIAFENTRLFEAEQASKRELEESLEYQTATSEVLNVISRSPNQLQPVFDVIAQSASRLCGDEYAIVARYDGELLHLVAQHNPRPGSADETARWFPQRPVPPSVLARAVTDNAVVHISDIADEDLPQSALAAFRRISLRAVIAVPMIHESRTIGTIAVSRALPGAFPQRQIELLRTFADQAVIAIENTRLFEQVEARTRELQEALDYQTATSDVLNVISRSQSKLKPVLDTIVNTATHLCQADYAFIWKLEGTLFQLAAMNGIDDDFAAFAKVNLPVLDRSTSAGRCVLEKRPIHIPDVLTDPEYRWHGQEGQRIGKYRTLLGVPLMREDVPFGAFALLRREARPFTDKEIGLVASFANQAVIAIENTRLFEAEQASKRELQESLDYQTATSDVLNVISRSKFDLQPVLDSILETAVRLCACDMGAIRHREGDAYVQLAGYGLAADYAEFSRSASWHHAGRGSLVGRVLKQGKAVQIPDVLADPDYTLHEMQRRGGFRSMLGVPLLRGADQIGIIVLMRRWVQAFSEKQIELVTAFADQAVIAIENTRLFEEVQTRTRELAKTVEDLEIASQHKNQFVANMSHELRTPLAAILGYAELMQEGFYEPPGQKSLNALARIRSNGKHLLGLINTVLDIAKIESGQFTLNMAEYTIESVVETVRSATESLAQNKKLLLKTEVAKSLPIGLGDEQRLTQVLLNLVGNAIKFTDAGEVRVRAVAANRHFAVSVADTGPGIPEEHQARIFEQFHQVDSSNTKAKGGTGLGLAIARQIVELHGGRIWVESRVGEGSTFQIEIPTRAAIR